MLLRPLLCLTLATFTACSSTPTGRGQLKLVDDKKMATMGNESYQELLKKTPLTKNQNEIKYVRCVADALLVTLNKNPKDWTVNVFQDDSANAFALPGNNIGVHTGMLKLATDQSELAAVMGHEIAHVEANHGNERVSQNMVLQGGLAVATVALSSQEKKTQNQLILAGLGVGAQFGVMLPFSRHHEKEADLMGLEYMARAGFNPDGAVSLWTKMAGQGKSPAEFMSTHPNPDNRIKYLADAKKKVIHLYESAKTKPNCKL